MPISKEHYELVKTHFLTLLGEKCSCGELDKKILVFHHPNGSELENGCMNSWHGRGRDVRMWEWFQAYAEGNLEIKCKDCHKVMPRKTD